MLEGHKAICLSCSDLFKIKYFILFFYNTSKTVVKPLYYLGSPPNKKVVPLEDFIAADEAAKNLTLCHEIALDNKFKINDPTQLSSSEVDLSAGGKNHLLYLLVGIVLALWPND